MDACPALTLRKLEENKGVGAAQNEGIALARSLGYAYVLLMDQDSVPHVGMVERLRNALEGLQAAGHKVACVGPRVRLPGSPDLSSFCTMGWLGRRYAPCTGANAAVECDALIASGSLIPLDVVERVGAMEEALFIDQVDTEWCLRARSKGYRVYGACGAVLEHRLGETAQRFWAGRWRRLPRHRPFRYYYIFRNTILVSRRKYTSMKWILFNARWLVTLLVLYGLFARDRNGELRMMFKGTLHGFKGVSGKLREP
jgi:rhamnosyltransferase